MFEKATIILFMPSKGSLRFKEYLTFYFIENFINSNIEVGAPLLMYPSLFTTEGLPVVFQHQLRVSCPMSDLNR